MEYVIVTFATDRHVYIDGEKSGNTNEVLRVDAGTHTFDLGDQLNYQPISHKVEVKDTTVLEPMKIAFTREDGD